MRSGRVATGDEARRSATGGGRWRNACRALVLTGLSAVTLCATLAPARAADMSPPGRPKGEYRSAQHEGSPLDKTLRVAFLIDVTGFDPQAMSDAYSGYVMRAVFDSAYAYDYYARPYKLVPNTTEALPLVTDGGKTFTFKLKKGIYFSDDPAFKGRKRELVAADYVYSWKRLLDPKVRSPNMDLLQDRIVGADALIEQAKKTNRFDYDAKLEGLQALDRYTIRLKLTRPDYNLLDNMTHWAMGAVAREVIEAYGDASTWATEHPVGTGPYVLKEWRRGSKVMLEASPTYRDVTYETSADPADTPLVAALQGKKVPAIGRVDISIIEESNPRFLAFDSKQLDFVYVPADFINRVIADGKLKPEYARQGIQWLRTVEPSFTYTFFNMDDPTIGGYTPEKIALRRAIVQGYNIHEEIKVIRQGQAMPATQPIPPGLPGHDAALKRPDQYDPAQAKALLDKFGYKDCDGDGFRELPGCKPLLLKLWTEPDALSRQFDELWKRSMDAIGIRTDFVKQKWPDTLKEARAGKVVAWQLGGIAAVREGESFLNHMYSKMIGASNYGNFRLDAYDKLFEKSQLLPDGPERNRIYRQLADYHYTYASAMLGVFRYSNVLLHPWVVGWKPHAFEQYPFWHLDIDLAKRAAATK
jgi:ABC-type transport system substrate-binding protein